MKWLLDLIWPKSPKTMAEVESSRPDVPVENLKPPAWKSDAALLSSLVLGPSDTMIVSCGPTAPEVDSLSRQVVALREEVARVKVEAMQAILEARHEAARDANPRAMKALAFIDPLIAPPLRRVRSVQCRHHRDVGVLRCVVPSTQCGIHIGCVLITPVLSLCEQHLVVR